MVGISFGSLKNCEVYDASSYGGGIEFGKVDDSLIKGMRTDKSVLIGNMTNSTLSDVSAGDSIRMGDLRNSTVSRLKVNHAFPELSEFSNEDLEIIFKAVLVDKVAPDQIAQVLEQQGLRQRTAWQT